MKQFKIVRIHLLILKWRFQFVAIQKFCYYGNVTKRLLHSWEKARVIVRIGYFHSVPGVQRLSNAIIAFVSDGGVAKINIVVVGPSMIGDPGAFLCCFYIIYVFSSL